jgi:hypothetical protein
MTLGDNHISLVCPNMSIIEMTQYFPLGSIMTCPNISNLLVLKDLSSLNMIKPYDRVTTTNDLDLI